LAQDNDSIRALLKQNLHKDTTFSDPGDLDTFLDLGKERIIQDSPHTLGVKTQTITTTASQQEDDLASDFWKIRGVWEAAQGQHLQSLPHSEWIDFVERLPTLPEGKPTHYNITVYDASSTVWKIRFYPTPDGALTIKVFYWWMPAEFTGTGTHLLSSLGFGELLMWAGTMIARSRNDPDGAQEAERHYNELMREYRHHNPQGPDSTSRLRSHMASDGAGGGSTLRLPPEYPAS